jgi:hypothetical protein
VSAVTIQSGANFAPNAHVSIYFTGRDLDFGGVAIGSGTTDGVGALSSIAITIPQAKAGTYSIRVIDDRSRFPAVAPFTVN